LQPTRSLSYSPLIQVMFVLQNTPGAALALQGLDVEPLKVDQGGYGSSKFDLTLNVVETGGGLRAGFNYNADLFEASTMARMVGHFEVLLNGVVEDPTQDISRLPMLTQAERQTLLMDWNDTAREYPEDQSIQQLFEAQVAQSPDAVAVSFCGDEVSYRALNEQANRLAHYLRRLGVTDEATVGVVVERSVEMIVALLAIVKAGAGYVPVDPAYPESRQRLMLKGASMVLTQRELAAKLSSVVNEEQTPILCVDDEAPAWCDEASSNLAPANSQGGSSLAYVMYTSGTTGVPKGINIEHRGVVRLVKNTDYVELDSGQVLLQLAPLSFDASTFEIWGALLNGGRLVVMPPGAVSLESVGHVIRDEGVTTLWLTAGLFHLMVDERLEELQPLEQLLAGGDVLSVAHVEKARRVLSGTRVINGYGPTENTTFSCCYEVSEGEDITSGVPIGRPIGNTQAYILDEHLSPVPIGVSGELYLGGEGLARDYVDDAALTAERFIENPYGSGRLYRTGDYARYRSDGNIEFQGRRDTQVKHNGYRIELGEIESQLGSHAGVTGAVCVLVGEEEHRYLAIYYTGEEALLESRELQGYLSARLPGYMVPTVYIRLESIPLTGIGKVDRAALPSPDKSELSQEAYVEPGTETEKALASIWTTLLSVDRVGVKDNFFELGGHSLLALKLASAIEKSFSLKMPLRALFENATLVDLAETIETMNGEKSTLIQMFDESSPEEKAAFLKKLRYEHQSGALTAFQVTGNRIPVFFVPAAGGTGLNYRKIATYLGDEQTVYSFDLSAKAKVSNQYESVEELAGRFVDELREVQSSGPYILGGVCFGGIVAWEMTRQLKAMGEKVGGLIFLDASLPQNGPDWSSPRDYRPSQLKILYDSVTNLVKGRFSRSARRFFIRRGWKKISRRWDKQNQIFQKLRQLQGRAWREYAATPIHVNVLFVCSDQFYSMKDYFTRWSNLIDGEIEEAIVPDSRHIDLLADDNEHLQQVASRVRTYLDRLN
ncbi:MAG: amino acid adenylation domain-containing protein, partial [Granulosicoccus sp.]|nr:amino acid adenylation domain-containing protein [Granulosicoccus sp.]